MWKSFDKFIVSLKSRRSVELSQVPLNLFKVNVLLTNILYIFIYFISTAFCSLIIVYCDIICTPKSTFVLYTLAANFVMVFFSYLAFVFFITSVKSPKSQGSKFRFKS